MILTCILIVCLVSSIILVIYYLTKLKKLEQETAILKTTNERYKHFVDTLINELKNNKEVIIVDNENIEYPTFENKIVVLMGKSMLKCPTLHNSIILFHPETTNTCIICPKFVNQNNLKETKDV